MKNVIGIDLGTTNCCVALMVDGRPKVIEDEKGYNILPSYIAIKGPNKFIVGHAAKAQAISAPRQTLRAVKRLIGRKINTAEVEEAKKRLGYDIIEGPSYEILLRLGETTLTPVDASSILLKCIKGIAEKSIGREISEAVITCPAYFTNAQRKATIEAGQKSGLRVLRLLNEPTAAALAYGHKRNLDRRILIYDLGGGTFDVSILEVGDNVYEVLATNGDSYLGGEDFDNRIVDHLALQFKEMNGVDLRDDPVTLQRIKDAAERAKCELSFVDKTQIMIPHILGTTNLQSELTRDMLEELTGDLVNRTFDVVEKTLKEANIVFSDVDEFILVGGQTRMPRIQETVKSLFGKSACKGVHPDEAVALGACIHADALTEDRGDILLLDVTPFALGIDSAGDIFTQIVPKNATIPLAESRTFTTVVDNQEKVKIVVRQGESKRASENRFLGEFVLTGIRRAPKMEPKIDVVFRIDSNGILNVSAKDRFTGERQSIVIKDYFERATNPEQEIAPVIVTDAQVSTEGETVQQDVPVPVEADSTEKEVKTEKKGKGLFSRLLGGLSRGSRKERATLTPAVDAAQTGLLGEGQPDISTEDAGTPPAYDSSGTPLFPPPPMAQPDRPLPLFEDALPPPDRDPLPPPAPEAGLPFHDPFGIQPRGAQASPWQESTLPIPKEESPLLPVEAATRASSSVSFEDPFAVVDRQDAAKGSPDTFSLPDSDPQIPLDAADPYAIEERRPDAPRRPTGRGSKSVSNTPTVAEDVLSSLDLDKIVDDLKSGVPTMDSPPVRPGKGSGRPDAARASEPPKIRTEAKASDVFGWTPPEQDPFAMVANAPPPKVPEADPFTPPKPTAPAPSSQAEAQGNLPSGFLDEVTDEFGIKRGPTMGPPQTVTGAAQRKKPARLKIAYRRVDAFVTEYTENLSRGGTFIKTPKPLEQGRECLFELTIPGRDTPILLKGTVVWSSKDMTTLDPGQDAGMGIRYDFDEENSLERMQKLMAELKGK